jgi:hypothetical protein
MKSAREFQTSADISRRVGGNAVKNNWSVSSRPRKRWRELKMDLPNVKEGTARFPF